MIDYLPLLKEGDDIAVYTTLLAAPKEQAAQNIAWLGRAIAIQPSHTIAAIGFLPEQGSPLQVPPDAVRQTVLAAQALGEVLVASRRASGYLLMPYDNLRSPCGQYAAARACPDHRGPRDGAERLLNEIAPSALPVYLVLALPAKSTEPLGQRLTAITQTAIDVLLPCIQGDVETGGCSITPALPLPEAVEHGRAEWLARLRKPPVTVPVVPWHYEVDGLPGECLFSAWPQLAVHFEHGPQPD